MYISDNGTVYYHYSHAKQILEIFKTLGDVKEQACETLCRLFLVTVVKNKGQQSLLSGRSGVLMPDKKQINSLADFELITWLIIRGVQALPDYQTKPELQP